MRLIQRLVLMFWLVETFSFPSEPLIAAEEIHNVIQQKEEVPIIKNLKNLREKRQVVQPTWLVENNPPPRTDGTVHVTKQNLEETADIRKAIQEAVAKDYSVVDLVKWGFGIALYFVMACFCLFFCGRYLLRRIQALRDMRELERPNPHPR